MDEWIFLNSSTFSSFFLTSKIVEVLKTQAIMTFLAFKSSQQRDKIVRMKIPEVFAFAKITECGVKPVLWTLSMLQCPNDWQAGYYSIHFFGLSIHFFGSSIQFKSITNIWLTIQIHFSKWTDNPKHQMGFRIERSSNPIQQYPADKCL